MGIHFQKKKKKISFLLFLSVFVIVFFQNIKIAQGNGTTSLTFTTPLEITEIAEKEGELFDVDSIQISFLSSIWNISSIELNFTNIHGGREIKAIEDNPVDYEYVYHKNPTFRKFGLAVQLTIENQTTIYGTYIYGYQKPGTVEVVDFQIGGYDSQNNVPNGDIWRTTALNLSTTPGWHYQNFSSYPITLSPGNYSLIINGTGLPQDDVNYYYWAYNPFEQLTPNLYRSESISGWGNSVVNSSFLYKLDQSINKTFYPQEVNLTAQINGDHYQILNGTSSGDGFLSIPECHISPQTDLLDIQIKNNESYHVLFDVNYSISLQHFRTSEGSVLINEYPANRWIFDLEFNRSSFSYFSAQINYSSLTWVDVNVFKGVVNVTSPYIVDTINKIIIFNNTNLSEDFSEWVIHANSPYSSFHLNVPITTFQPQQELKFSIDNPVPGNYTCILIDPLGFDIYSNTIELPGDTNQFSYSLSSNPYEGVYNAYIFFYNKTHAGWQHQAFTVNVPYVLDPNTVYIIIIAIFTVIFISAITGITSYQVIKRYRTKRERYQQKIFNMYMDVFNLNYFMVINKTSGLNVYEQVLTGKDIDPTLVSGFLQAIRTFGIELTDANDQSQTIKLEFQNSIILMAEFRQFRLIFIMKENPSQDFIDSIRLLSKDIDEVYGNFIVEFKGDRQHFTGIRELLERNLNISLIYPLKVVESANIRLKTPEKNVVSKARSLMKEKIINYFYVSYFMSDKKEFNVRTAEIILNLIHKKIFQPII